MLADRLNSQEAQESYGLDPREVGKEGWNNHSIFERDREQQDAPNIIDGIKGVGKGVKDTRFRDCRRYIFGEMQEIRVSFLLSSI